MSQKENQGNRAVKAVGLMMMITLIGKVLGLVRDQFLAANYAWGMEAAAFFTASRIPRTFFDAVFASAISASFIPVFNEYLKNKGKDEAFGLANRFLTLMFVVTVAMMFFGMAFAEDLVRLFAVGYDAETIALATSLSKLLFPTIVFTAIAFSFVGILQSLDEFNVPAAISVASNVVIIAYYIYFNDQFGVYGLTIAFLIGWAMQAIIQLPALRKKGYGFRPDFRFRDEGLKKIGVLMLPVMVSTWIQPINFLINSRFASQLPNGEQGVSALEYANTLYTIIVGVFVLAIANLIFPKLSRISGEENKEEFSSTVKVTLRSMMFLLIPMMVGMMALSEPLVRVIYERGSFTADATEITSIALFFFALGVIGYGIQTILSRAFYANQDGKMPFYSGLVSIAINGILCGLLMEPMGLGGLALASAASSTAAAVVLLIPTLRKYPAIVDKGLLKSIGKMMVSAGGMLVFVWGSYAFLTRLLGGGLVSNVLKLGIPTAIGVLVYMVLSYIIGVEEGRFAFAFVGEFLQKRKTTGEGSNQEIEVEDRGYAKLIGRISNAFAQSGSFRLVETSWNKMANIWMSGLVYGWYSDIGFGVGHAIDNSFVVQKMRGNWDDATEANDIILNRRNKEKKKNTVRLAMEESLILGICNEKFLMICLCAIVFAIPIFPTMILAAACAATFLVYLINLYLGRVQKSETSLVSIFVGLFGLTMVYGSVTSFQTPRSLLVMGITLTFIAMFFVAKDCIDTEEKLNFVLIVMITTGALIGLYAVYQYIVGVEIDPAWVDAESFTIETRAYATFSNPNVLGEYLILMGALAAGMLWKMRNWVGRFYFAGCFGVICLGLVATNSRGAMLGLLFAAGLFVLLSEKRLIPLGIGILFAMPFILPQSLWERLLSSITMQDSSSQYRISIYEAGMKMVEAYGLTGIGVDAFPTTYPLFSFEAANAYHVHNLFLQVLIELGVVGFGILVLLVIFFFQKLYSKMRVMPKRFWWLSAAFFGGFAGLLLQGMTDHLWFDYRIVLLFWMYLGIGMATVKVGEKQWQKQK
ncbi:murein biosynthesis integral membrane protein MurJ [Chakrabartyella piscis]|uniref:murein biosynthesis integral membrane protein MurJ n=1 Tax=Chakrabartyella piscis TaxID=2918914 RepID=UPI002958651A|nr:murein biosynthesis integral membrane protein MurJ [Chakrabartyella piscis]